MKQGVRMLFLLVSVALGVALTSCNDDNEQIQANPIQQQLLGKWYDGAQRITFTNDEVKSRTYSTEEKSYKYTLVGNELTVDGYSALNGTISYIDAEKFTITRVKYKDWTFERKMPNVWKDVEEDEENPPSYTNYIHYKYCGMHYYHEISHVQQDIEYAPSGTVHGWNYKYLNVFIGDAYPKIGFQFESTYKDYDYPPTTPWPAKKYNITTTTGSSVTNNPIARLNVYNKKMKFLSSKCVTGVGEIKYSGNTMVFDFTSNEKNSDYYVDIHFEGTISK